MANEARVKITLVCTECKRRNYDTKKNKKNDPDRLEMKKHCPFCRKHTLHKESKEVRRRRVWQIRKRRSHRSRRNPKSKK